MRMPIVLGFLAAACSGTERLATTQAPPQAVTMSAPAPADAAVLIPDAAPPPDAEPALAARIELTFMGDVMCGGMFDGKWFPKDWENHDPLAEMKDAIASDL